MFYWIVSLDNGERLSSKDLEGGQNPFTKVLEYIRTNVDLKGNKRKITHVELIVNNVRYNSPSLSKRSSFCSNDNLEMFYVMYKDSAVLNTGVAGDNYVAYSYRLGEYRHFFWVNTKNNCCYAQTLNVVNPTNGLEEKYSMTERDFEETYKKVYNIT